MICPSTVEIRKEVIRSIANQRDARALVEIARKEKDPELKREVVRRLSGMKDKEATDYLIELIGK
jgi:HEAT repeat protein